MNSSLTLNSTPTNTSVSESCEVKPQHVSITVFLCLVFLLGFFLNSYSLWVFCCRLQGWSSGTVLQFNLALSDATGSPATLMMAVYFTMGSHWTFGRFLCQLQIALLSTHLYGSIVFLTLISIHRYVAVAHFNRISPMKRKEFVQKLCGGVWMVLLVKALVYVVILPPEDHTRCLTLHEKNLTNVYFVLNFIVFIFGFLMPFLVSVACYSRLANIVSHINSNSSKGLAVKLKSLRMIGICLVIFGLCFLPLNVVRTIGVVIMKYYSKECHTLRRVEAAYYVSWIVAGVNCCLDPMLYVFGSHTFSSAFKRSFNNGPVTQDNRPELTRTAPIEMGNISVTCISYRSTLV